MNRRLFVSPFLLAVIVTLAAATTSSRGAELSSQIRGAADASSYAATIHSYITSQIKDISQTRDPAAATKARINLISEVQGIVPPSDSFLNLYCQDLTPQLIALASTPNASPQVRLNVAIITAKVAEKTLYAGLGPLVLKQLDDANEGVVLWGLKAARWVIAPALNVDKLGTNIISAVSRAAKRLPTGPIVQTAYDALGDTTAATSLIGPVQDLLAWRIEQYVKGPPVEPTADARATAYLTDSAVWLKAQTSAQRTRTLQLLRDLVLAAVADLNKVQAADRGQLVSELSKAGKAIYVIGINNQNEPLKAAVTPLTMAKESMTNAEIATASAAALDALKAFAAASASKPAAP